MNYYEMEDEENRKLIGLPPLRIAELSADRSWESSSGVPLSLAWHLMMHGDPREGDAEILRSLGIEPVQEER